MGKRKEEQILKGDYITHRRGFCVARSTTMGNARASKRGTGDGYRSPRFFCCSILYHEYHLKSTEGGRLAVCCFKETL